MRKFVIFTIISLFLCSNAHANYPSRYMFIDDCLYFSDGYWQIVHQEFIIDADGIQFIHIGE